MGKREDEKKVGMKHKHHHNKHTKRPVGEKNKTTPLPKQSAELEFMIADECDVVDVETTTTTPISTPTPTLASTPPAKATTSKATGSSKKVQSAKPATSTPTLTPSSGATPATPAALTPTSSNLNAKKPTKKRRESGTSSDEERWLTAIEAGKLEDVDDELKKIKDPKLMTARQRAMYEKERNLDKEPSPGGEMLLMSLPNGYREKDKPQTAEDIQKAVLKSQKRKQLADEKREKDKKKTMERLLKKQECTNKQRLSARNRHAKSATPMISYHNSVDGVFIQLPPGHEFPLAAQRAREPPKVQLCGIVGCGRPKVYNCSKTNLPLCSLKCFNKNVQAVRQIMC